jgi:transposase-like protein
MKSEREVFKEQHQDYSNGYRHRKAFGHQKAIELSVPRTRNGFYPTVLALLKDQESEAHAIAFDLYKKGLTTDQVGETFDIIYGKKYSTSQVSRMFEGARDEITSWLKRPLLDYYPIVYIDCVFLPTRRVDSVSKEAYYVLLAVKPDRTREVLGIYNSPTEGANQWKSIFEDIKSRGVKKIDLFVSDALQGIEDSIAFHYSKASIQLCVVHLQRHMSSYVKPKHKKEFAEDFKEVFYTNNKEDSKGKAIQRFNKMCDKWSKYYISFTKKKQDLRTQYYFTFYDYDYRMRSMIYTTNWIERLNRDFRRTTRMRGALPKVDAALLLLGGVAMDISCYQRKVPKLDYEKEKFNWEE